MSTESSKMDRLYRAALEGNAKAENDLMSHLAVSFRIFAQRKLWRQEDVEEVVQEALLTVSTKYREIEIESSFAGWCYRILQNKILDHVKKAGTRARLDREREATCSGGYEPTPSDIELRKRIIECFRKLGIGNRRHARILNLHYQGYSTDEICAKLGVSENNLYVILSRARAALLVCLGLEEGKK